MTSGINAVAIASKSLLILASVGSVSATHPVRDPVSHPDSGNLVSKEEDDETDEFEDDSEDYTDDDLENGPQSLTLGTSYLHPRVRPLLPTKGPPPSLLPETKMEAEKIERRFQNLSIDQFKRDLYKDLGHVEALAKGEPRYMAIKEAESLRLRHALEKPHRKEIRAPVLSRTTPLAAALVRKLPQPPPMVIRKQPKRTKSLTCLVVPVSEPVFPTLAIHDLRILNPAQKSAVLQMADADRPIALFYVKDPRFRSFDIVTERSDVHEKGVLARISGYTSYTDPMTGLKPLIVLLTTLGVVEMGRLFPPEKRIEASLPDSETNSFGGPSAGETELQLDLDMEMLLGKSLQRLVCWAHVRTHSAKCSRKWLPEVRDITGRIIRRLVKLYHKSDDMYRKIYIETLRRNTPNLEALSKDFNFYDSSKDTLEVLNVKLNVAAELVKQYFRRKFKERGGESAIRLQYYMTVFQSISEDVRMDFKARDLLNLLEIESTGGRPMLGYKPSNADPGPPPKSAGLLEPETPSSLDLEPDQSSLELEDDEQEEWGANKVPEMSTGDIVLGERTPKLSPEDSIGTDETLLSSFSAGKATGNPGLATPKDKIVEGGMIDHSGDIEKLFKGAKPVETRTEGAVVHNYYTINNYYYKEDGKKEENDHQKELLEFSQSTPDNNTVVEIDTPKYEVEAKSVRSPELTSS